MFPLQRADLLDEPMSDKPQFWIDQRSAEYGFDEIALRDNEDIALNDK